MPLGEPKPICLGCSYEIDAALGRRAKCPECGREYDLDARESYGPTLELVNRVRWSETCAAVFIVGVVGALLPTAFGTKIVLTLVACGGAVAACRREWKIPLAVLLVVHVVFTVMIAIRTAGFLSPAWLIYGIFAPAAYFVAIAAGALIARGVVALIDAR